MKEYIKRPQRILIALIAVVIVVAIIVALTLKKSTEQLAVDGTISAGDVLDDDIAEIVEDPSSAPADGFAEEPEYAPLFTNDDFAEIVQ